MINVNKELILQSLQPCALNAIALQKNCCVVIAIYAFGLNDGRSERQLLVNAGYAMAQHHFCLLAHPPQDFLACKTRSDGVAIGAVVRREHKPLAAFDLG
jgi:hypothetical protein